METKTMERRGRREVLLKVYGTDGASLLGTLAGEAGETVGDVFGRSRRDLGFSDQVPLCLSRRVGPGEAAEDHWESIPEQVTLGEIAVDDQVDVAVDEDAQLG